jgi:hypothetical protein
MINPCHDIYHVPAAAAAKNVDACKHYPCMNNENSAAVCKDKGGDAPDSPDGRTCSCVTPNHTYQDDLLGCLGMLQQQVQQHGKQQVQQHGKQQGQQQKEVARRITCITPKQQQLTDSQQL